MTASHGVNLATLQECVPIGAYVHMARDDWTITSTIPIGHELLCSELCERCLPGYLGAYIYPKDAVFCIKDKEVTTADDLQRVLERERTRERFYTNLKMNHLTFHQAEEISPQLTASAEGEVDALDEGEELEEDPDGNEGVDGCDGEDEEEHEDDEDDDAAVEDDESKGFLQDEDNLWIEEEDHEGGSLTQQQQQQQQQQISTSE